MGVSVGHNDDGGSSIDLVKIEEASLFFSEFHIFTEESEITFSEVCMFIIEFLLNEYLLKFCCTDPGEKL